MRKVYVDNAATTYVSNEVLTEMLPVFNTVYGNSSSLHNFGRDALTLLDRARERVAKAINADPSEIYFTSGGTEANNWALRGIANANKSKGNHIITSQIEHHSVLDTCKYLETRGFKVTYLPVDETGLVSIADLLHHLDDKTVLVSIMAANNEIGTIQNLQTISKIAQEKGAIFHTDAVQAIGAINIDVKQMGVDSLSLTAHKIYGPKGIGALYVKKGIKIDNLIIGGNQEKGKRGGTVDVAGAVGLGKAIEVAVRDMSINSKKLKTMREYFTQKVTQEIADVKINGHIIQRLPGIVNISFHYIEGESLLLMLDMQGVGVSTGSACSSGSLEQSHVLKAIGLPAELGQGSIRFSFGKSTTKDEVDYVIEVLKKQVKKLRDISPLSAKKK
jgi:cysteine desulfurase